MAARLITIKHKRRQFFRWSWSVNKRSFLKLFSAMITARVFSPLLGFARMEKLTNWAGNLVYSTERLHSANSVEDVRAFVKQEQKLKVLGTRHCFNNIADSQNNFLSLKPIDQVVALDARSEERRVGKECRS